MTDRCPHDGRRLEPIWQGARQLWLYRCSACRCVWDSHGRPVKARMGCPRFQTSARRQRP